jgi:anti-sigma-K factor RskA
VPHLTHDQLVSLAMGEPEGAEDAVHTATCEECRDDLATLRRLVAIGPETKAVLDLPAPPAALFDRVVADVRAAESLARPRSRDMVVDPPVSPRQHLAAVADNPLPPWRRHRGGRNGWSRRTAGAVAAVAAAILAVAATLAVTPQSRPVDVLATATLAAYGQTPPTAHGNAQVLADDRMRIRVADLPAVRGYYEVWLIDPATMRMFSVGRLPTATSNAEMELPANVDLTRYRVVDVSAEQYDNNPAHSGDSLVRGELP